MRRAFTLAEVMIAMLFVSIAMFGYIALHMRIIHSSTTLQQRNAVRRKMDLQHALANRLIKRQGLYPPFIDEACLMMMKDYVAPAGDGATGNYTCSHEAFEPPLYQFPDSKIVTVQIISTVSWVNQHGPQQYLLDSYQVTKDAGW
jgi:hypothetical protein